VCPSSDKPPIPTELKLKKKARQLEVAFTDGLTATLTAEYLRVHSPSAEVTGHSAGERLLVTGKQDVAIESIEPVGRYAVRIVFDDGHDTGLYTWPILYDLCGQHDRNWSRYLERLHEAGERRDASKRSSE
jgi:DUF971 family protein